MVKDNFSDLEGDFDVLCNVVSTLPAKYDIVTKVMDAKKFV